MDGRRGWGVITRAATRAPVITPANSIQCNGVGPHFFSIRYPACWIAASRIKPSHVRPRLSTGLSSDNNGFASLSPWCPFKDTIACYPVLESDLAKIWIAPLADRVD